MVFVFLSVNAVAAMLTALEFVAGLLAIASFRTTILGIWLYRLHQKKVIPFRLFNKPYYAIGIEALCFFISTGLVIFVAVVELKMDQSFRIVPQQSNSSFCAFMNESLSITTMNEYRIPSQFVIDDASIEIAKQVHCKHGLKAVDFGTDTNGTFLFAPECVPVNQSSLVTENNNSVPPAVFPPEYELGQVGSIVSTSSSAYIIPYNMKNSTYGFSSPAPEDENEFERIPECTAKNISSVITKSFPYWRTRDVDDYNISRSFLQTICEQENNTLSEATLPLDTKKDCKGEQLFPQCLRKKAVSLGDKYLHSVKLTNVAVLTRSIAKQGLYETRACVNATVQYEFVYVPGPFFKQRTYSDIKRLKNKSVLVPTRIEVLSGSCEPTLNTLGLAALVYSTQAEWPGRPNKDLNDRLLKLSRQQRYHAYMVSIARSSYPFEVLGHRKSVSKPCSLHKVVSVTQFQTDGFYVMMLATFGLICLMVVIALAFRWALPRHAWKVANYAQHLTVKGNINHYSSVRKSTAEMQSEAVFRSEGQNAGGIVNPKLSSSDVVISVQNEDSQVNTRELAQGQGRPGLLYRIKSVRNGFGNASPGASGSPRSSLLKS